jgi:hypothetical protein
VKERYGIDVSRQQVFEYDPTTTRRALGKKRTALFEKAREAFKKSYDSIPIANRAYRLRRLQKLAETAEDRGAITLAAGFLEQAAKEVGDVFTNRQKVDHSGTVGHEHWLKQLPP